MSRGYDDLNDLIQNQRALAELVHDIKEHYDEFSADIEYAKTVDLKIQELNEELTTTMNNFSGQMSDLDIRMQAMLQKMLKDTQDMKDQFQEWADALQINADGDPASLKKLVADIVYLTNLIMNGVEGEDGESTGSLQDIHKRVKILESKTPGLVIYEDGPDNDIPIEDRIEGVLYGRRTDQVTDIQSGQVIKISPYLQGVIVDVD